MSATGTSALQSRQRTDWEQVLRDWSKPMDEQQEEKARRTAQEVEAALDNYSLLDNGTFQTFPQGSKYNNTDVPGDSDVDIGVKALVDVSSRANARSASFVVERATKVASASNAQLGLAPPSGLTMPTTRFKDRVHDALVDHFGAANVERGDKCIKVRSSRLTLPADVVPCFPYRHYYDASPASYVEGVRLYPDSGGTIENFPDQHHRNGVAKNNDTSRRFKRMVRCLKRLENELVAAGELKDEVPSFLMECLMYEVPNDRMASESYLETFEACILHAWSHTRTEGEWRTWLEVNEVKPLFKAVGGTFDRAQANQLLLSAFTAIR